MKTEDQTAYSKDVLNRLGVSSNDLIGCNDYAVNENALGTTKNGQLEAEIWPLLWNDESQFKSELETDTILPWLMEVIDRLGGSSNDVIRCTECDVDENALRTTKNGQLEAEIRPLLWNDESQFKSELKTDTIVS